MGKKIVEFYHKKRITISLASIFMTNNGPKKKFKYIFYIYEKKKLYSYT